MTAPLRERIATTGEDADRELVQRCLSGDTGAWRMLYDRHAPQVHRFLSRFGVVHQEREDVVQEVFVAVYRSLPRFRGDAQLSTWIYRIAARLAVGLERRRRVKELRRLLVPCDPDPPEPWDPAERAARLRALDRMLNSLSPKKRVVFVLFEIEGVPVPQIAEVVGCPENTVWSRLAHARAEMLEQARRSAP